LLIPAHAALISKQRAAIESSQARAWRLLSEKDRKTSGAIDAAHWLGSPPQATHK
jgi:hypothetical protein